MPRPILISAGGTGGGVYPAVAAAEALKHLDPQRDLHFVGSVGGIERDLVPQQLFTAYHEVRSGPLNGVGVRRAAVSAIKILIGTAQSWRLIDQIRPALLFVTGGWATFPAALACRLRGIPIVIFLPDIEPARAIKVMSRLSRIILATSTDSARYFAPGTKVVETGYPLRDSVHHATREAGIAHFDLDSTLKTLLVFGGSLGAHSLNVALGTILPDLLSDGLQIVHVTGQHDWPTIQAALQVSPPVSRYHPFAYLHDDMGLALAAADLVVSRAGASTLGEFPQFGLPSILVPLAFAWRYQRVNADWLMARGASIRLDDNLLGNELLPTIRRLVGDPARLQAMSQAAAALARPGASETIAHKLIEMADSAD